MGENFYKLTIQRKENKIFKNIIQNRILEKIGWCERCACMWTHLNDSWHMMNQLFYQQHFRTSAFDSHRLRLINTSNKNNSLKTKRLSFFSIKQLNMYQDQPPPYSQAIGEYQTPSAPPSKWKLKKKTKKK